MADYFDPKDVEAGKLAIKEWKRKNPEAAAALKELWRATYMKTGHKNLARELIGGD